MKFRYEVFGQVHEVVIERQGPGYRASVDGEPFELEVLDSQPGELSLMLFGSKPVKLYWANDGNNRWVSVDGCSYQLTKPSPRSARRSGGQAATGEVRAPMPAQVRSIEVAAGDEVETGATLMILEAMKMEIRVQAPRSGRIGSVKVEPGQTVNRDELLVELAD